MGNVEYSKDFKAQCVASYLSRGKRSVNQVAKDLGIAGATLAKWAKNSNQASEPVKGRSTADIEQIRTLEKQVFQLRLEVDFLKKMSIYLAQENPSPFKK